ncbi:uncharacterized protein LTR77_003094 [Saxophila tyrrhenica]|uniref:Nucleoporin Pom152 n=1 Tax=Saxophila tyrrhenica TaxID=1690608 RepID=A0AAV9PJZ0_9PEZI|nr:hypothetical protein LTR77_003094 [Saxophila tyrrhenica]
MDQTPRLRSAFPQTPATSRRSTQYGGSPSRQRKSAPLPSIPTVAPASSQPPSDPLIPEHILDAPTQRLFVVSLAIALWSWRIYDWSMLNESEEQSLWLFMKWVAVDGVFLFGLPGLRIPWLEWDASTMALLFFFHAMADMMLMFRIPIPVSAGLAALGRNLWGAYEMAVNEHTVNAESVRFNESLILGRQIIHILPEGSAELNPSKDAFCLDQTRTEVRLPIKINSTNPIAMELLRTDLDTQQNETIHISKANIKNMHKEASRLVSYSEKPNEPKTLYYTVKKPGLYVLAKVLDETNLEVSRKRLAHTVVASCPRAAVISTKPDRCRGDLSSLEMEVVGAPPLTLKYRKLVNQVSQDATFENILPEDFSSPLARQDPGALVVPNKVDTIWAKSQRIVVPISESLGRPGNWVYSIDEVSDAFGNRVSYSARENQDPDRRLAKNHHIHQVVNVHERPTITVQGCTPQRPLKVAKGASTYLPLQYGSTGRGEVANTSYHVQYTFSAQGQVSANGELPAPVEQNPFVRKQKGQQPRIGQAGLYTVTSVSTDFCTGEVLEPASCVLQNPPEPKLTLQSTELSDKCAGRPIGLMVDFDLVGTPPFDIKYRVKKKNDRHHGEDTVRVGGLRGQLELKPPEAGHYTYEFLSISDAVYVNLPIAVSNLEQDVKPSAFARFLGSSERQTRCIEDSASLAVALSGQGPFTLEYELVHSGRRKKYTLNDVDTPKINIETEPLRDGGEYTLALISVTDAMQCKESLRDEAKIYVRPQKPKVGFKTVNGQRSINTVERKNVELPLRLEGGDGPWSVKYRDQNGRVSTLNARGMNEWLSVSDAGIYELVDVHDAACPGVVDDAAKTFEVSWKARPEMRIAPSDAFERRGNTFVKSEVCEGGDDAIEMLFKGAAPFQANYVQHVKLEQKASIADQHKEIKAASNMASMRLDTRMAGTYEYRFTQLTDSNYDHHSPAHFTPVTVQQKVNARPSAAFASPNKNYKFCSVESDGEEVVPITLHGAPPFDLEIEIKHQSAAPETVSLTGISSTSYNLRIPHSRLHVGRSSIHLRRISDSRGCIRSLDSTTPSVKISVHDAPTITELDASSNFCVGDRINFALSGTAPFHIFYTFEGHARKAVVQSTTFRRLAEKPGTFVVTGVQDSASGCKSTTHIEKHIHGLPSVRVSDGRDSYIDIHEGGSTEIQFDFGGAPPFEFTYTRSSNTEKNGRKAGAVLDMHSEVSDGHRMRVRAHEEGTYEVVSIKDRYCAYSKPGVKVGGEGGQRRLTY